jgi:hypothetical protein
VENGGCSDACVRGGAGHTYEREGGEPSRVEVVRTLSVGGRRLAGASEGGSGGVEGQLLEALEPAHKVRLAVQLCARESLAPRRKAFAGSEGERG